MREAWGIGRASVALLMCSLVACSGESDADGKDASAGDAQLADGQLVIDGRVVDGSLDRPDGASSGRSCADHHDCDQKEFCHRGTCRLDAQPVYHCGVTGCPPGHWCVEADGKRDRCGEDLTHECQNACDCGPAHCCIDHDGDGKKSCIKDATDPWLPGSPSSSGATCKTGPEYPAGELDPTYCAVDHACDEGREHWQEDSTLARYFRAFDPESELETNLCRKKTYCYTACDCEPQESCTRFSYSTQLGQCRAGGFACHNRALAEAVLGVDASALLPCCTERCSSGSKCETDAYLYYGTTLEPVPAICSEPENCNCGDSICCVNEIEQCPSDCLPLEPSCGNSQCELFETWINCPSDCADGCGTGICEAGEDAASCPQDCQPVCGDRRCTPDVEDVTSCPEDCTETCNVRSAYSLCGDKTCDYLGSASPVAPVNDPILTRNEQWTETCLTCPADCGKCLPAMMQGN